MVSILSIAVRWRDVPQLVDERVSELAYLRCRSGEGAR
jgi:hypothetical protein